MNPNFSKEKLNHLKKIIWKVARPKTPILTQLEAELKKFPEIRAVLFDVYGTTLVSGIEPMQKREGHSEAISVQESFDEHNVEYEAGAPKKALELMREQIENVHRQKRKSGIDYAEVEIISIWEDIMEVLKKSGDVLNYNPDLLPDIIVYFVIHYDQPWPMPGLEKTLSGLRERNIPTGIISNSQFYSSLTLEALCEKSLDEMGFNDDLCFWSFAEDIAKPSTRFYDLAKNRLLKEYNIPPEQVLFVGNDMLKDVYPAHQVGFKTALFAGDIRSLRLRENDERCKNLKPDIRIIHLEQVLECLAG